MKYRIKPVVIDAIQLTEESIFDCYKLVHGDPNIKTQTEYEGWNIYEDVVMRDGLNIPTLEGTMTARIGDWIITGVNGEKYPCKPDIFEKTYERVTDQN
jgi:hypothetical protein